MHTQLWEAFCPSLPTITTKCHENTGLQEPFLALSNFYCKVLHVFPIPRIQLSLLLQRVRKVLESDACTNHTGLKTTLKQDKL